jgi:hypothetical protein
MQPQIQKRISTITGGLSADPAQGGTPTIDFRSLRDMLPDSVDGLPRVDIAGETAGVGGVQGSSATATYQNREGQSVTIRLSDLGGLPGLEAKVEEAWESVSLSRESDEGYTRTVQISGFKAREQYEYGPRSGTVTLMAGSRVLVEVTGTQVEPSALTKAVEAMDVEAISALRPAR